MGFYDQVNDNVTKLNRGERKLFEFAMHNAREVSSMSIREFAERTYVSTTTVLRFVRKLGFDGYRDFTQSMMRELASEGDGEPRLPGVMWKKSYSQEYLKNIIESVRVVSQGEIDRLINSIGPNTHIWCVGVGLDQDVAHYAYHVLTVLGYQVSCPMSDFERRAAVAQFAPGDVAMLFSLTGEDREVVEFAERVAHKGHPAIATVTQSANNTLQSIGNIDFYVFGESISFNEENLSSRVSILVMVDLITYGLMRSLDEAGCGDLTRE